MPQPLQDPPARESDSELPSYRQSISDRQSDSDGAVRRRTEHSFRSIKGGRPWLTLRVYSEAESSNEEPSFLQGTAISGFVNVDLVNQAIVRSVSVSVIGEVSADAHRFITITRQLYVSDTSEILSPDSDAAAGPEVGSGKLVGSHTWSFTIRLPKGICIVSTDGSRHTYRLPSSMDNHARIQYQLVVRVKKGVLSPGHRLVVPFRYTPQARPRPPSILRQIAYLENTPLIGPEGDADGWHTFESIQIHGKLFNSRPIVAICTLSIARPLCYTRGTVIPLAMTLQSSDEQGLDLLSSPNAPTARLTRTSITSPSFIVPHTDVGTRLLHSEVISTAIWWSVGAPLDGQRYLQGELAIPADAPPNCCILNFAMNYNVVLYPFRAVAFSSGQSETAELLAQPVEIVTVDALSPRPISYVNCPPQYS
ncbi:hypothetical protein K474DRAFT_1663295 [Panus rudis PR-1116 ss-1]|nr:hypothetical protein K474DRAFT_1663295 [Panus rudis PR-1116 ss-1]